MFPDPAFCQQGRGEWWEVEEEFSSENVGDLSLTIQMIDPS